MKKVFIVLIVCLLIFSGCNSKENLNIEKIAVNNIVINKSHAYVDEGDKIVLLAQVFPFNADNQNIIWKSDNNYVASVDNGIVVGKEEGRTVITAESEDGGYSASCVVYVSSPKLNYNNTQNNLTAKNISAKENYTKGLNNSFDYFYLEDFIHSVETLFKNLQNNFITQHKFNFINNINKSDNLEDGLDELLDENEDKSFAYKYEYLYNSSGINSEDEEDVIYKDDNTIVKEKYYMQ